MSTQATTLRVLIAARQTAEGQRLHKIVSGDSYTAEMCPQNEQGFNLCKQAAYDVILIPIDSDDSATALELAERLNNIHANSQIVLIGDADVLAGLSPTHLRFADGLIRRPYTKTSLLRDLSVLTASRPQDRTPGHICTGRITLCGDTKTVLIDGKPVDMDPIEYALLEIFSQRKNYTLSKEKLMSYLFGEASDSDPKLIDMYVYRLRKKLTTLCNESYIHTKWEGGYVFADPTPCVLTPATADT
jgi:two-component system cell cycle response regulator CtrA